MSKSSIVIKPLKHWESRSRGGYECPQHGGKIWPRRINSPKTVKWLNILKFDFFHHDVPNRYQVFLSMKPSALFHCQRCPSKCCYLPFSIYSWDLLSLPRARNIIWSFRSSSHRTSPHNTIRTRSDHIHQTSPEQNARCPPCQRV
jgi:hypothetical protein